MQESNSFSWKIIIVWLVLAALAFYCGFRYNSVIQHERLAPKKPVTAEVTTSPNSSLANIQ